MKNIRSLQLLSNGVFAVHKIHGITSAQVVETLKQIILNDVPSKDRPHPLKCGHGGTLDETATGVLVIGTGYGCKILPRLLHGSKRYIVTGQLGIATDTFNETGAITLQSSYDHITKEMLCHALEQFQGHILQTPPKYSALKLHGTRLADLTRAGVEIEVKPRPVTCHAVRCIDFSPPAFKLSVYCEGGFYVRSLINDLGTALNSCAHASMIRRTQHGPFSERDMLEPSDWTIENILVAIRIAGKKYNTVLKQPRKRKVDVWDDN